MNTVIIGGGVAGLTAGIRLAEAGMPVTLLEKQGNVGGNLTGWSRGEYLIDNCMHWLTGTRAGGDLYALWRETGMLGDGVSLCHTPAFYESRMGQERIALSSSLEETERAMCALSPTDSHESHRFCHLIRAFTHVATAGSALSRGRATLALLPSLLSYRKVSLADLSERFHHPLLQCLLTDYIGGEFSVLALAVAYANYLVGNGDIPYGGSHAAAERMRDTFLSYGGQIRYGCEATKVERAGGYATAVQDSTGMRYPCSFLVCACDPSVTFSSLFPDLPFPSRYHLEEKGEMVFSSIQAAYAVARDALPFSGTQIIDAPALSVRSGARMICRAYSEEPSFAPDGKTVLQTMVFQTQEEANLWIAQRKDPAVYRERKNAVEKRMTSALLTAYPALGPSLELLDVWTPATYARYTGGRSGAYLAYATTPHTSLRRASCRIPHMKNAFLATQWERTPGGLPTAARAGARTADTILAKI